MTYRWDDVSRLRVPHLKFEDGPQGQIMRVTLVGGKTAMLTSHSAQRIVTCNVNNPDMCLVSLTKDYLAYLGKWL